MSTTQDGSDQTEARTDPPPITVDMSTARINAFTDGVYAIAITLLELDLHYNYLAYVMTFLIIGVIWMNHHLMFHYIRRVDHFLLLLNLLMLMSVAFLPWPANMLSDAIADGHGENSAAVLYGGTLFFG